MDVYKVKNAVQLLPLNVNKLDKWVPNGLIKFDPLPYLTITNTTHCMHRLFMKEWSQRSQSVDESSEEKNAVDQVNQASTWVLTFSWTLWLLQISCPSGCFCPPGVSEGQPQNLQHDFFPAYLSMVLPDKLVLLVVSRMPAAPSPCTPPISPHPGATRQSLQH